jgi:lipopolysaccharide transport system ATP-binding protein
MPILRINDLGKKYTLGKSRPRYSTLRESIDKGVRGLLRRSNVDLERSELWALRNVTFEVEPGEVVGIIGRNGAGKSTLLKILSRITQPTEGKVELFGRVASLLEVGTGFHPELTGRENIYLNGAIMGMTRAEMRKKFDAIVDFAEVERFLDTPVKHYSSGMYMRLAFSVAAHLEPEILLVDEVLTVGDAAFQKKCIWKMEGVAREGRTVLFVSHQMAAIEALCTRCLLLADGRLEASGSTREIIQKYLVLAGPSDTGRRTISPAARPRASSSAVMTEVAVSGSDGVPASGFPMGTPLTIQVSFETCTPMEPVLGVVVKTALGVPLFGINNRITGGPSLDEICSQGVIRCHFEQLPLMPGNYHIDLYLGDAFTDMDVVQDAISFEVFATDVFGTGKLPPAVAGPLFMPARWTLEGTAASKAMPLGAVGSAI